MAFWLHAPKLRPCATYSSSLMARKSIGRIIGSLRPIPQVRFLRSESTSSIFPAQSSASPAKHSPSPMENTQTPLWKPLAPDTTQTHQFRRYVNDKHGLALASYEDLWTWSTNEITLFWNTVWDYTNVVGDKGNGAVNLPPYSDGVRNQLTLSFTSVNHL